MKNLKFSLRFRVMALALGITFALGGASFFIVRGITTDGVAQGVNTTQAQSVALSDAIAAQFYERYGDVQAFSINPTILSSDRKPIVELLNTYAAMYGIYDLIMVSDKNGKLVAVNDKDPSGKPIASSKLYSKNFSDSPWLRAAVDGKLTEEKDRGFAGTFAEDVQVDPYTTEVFGEKRLGTAFTAPIRDSRGNVIGAITNRAGSRWFEVAFKEAYDALRDSGFPSSELYLLSKDKTVVYNFDPKRIQKDGSMEFDWNLFLKEKIGKFSTTLNDASFAKDNAFLEENDGAEYVVGFSPVNGAKFLLSMGWSVVVRDSTSEAFADLYKSQRNFYLSFFIGILFAAGISFYFSNSIGRRLSNLAEILHKGSSAVTTTANEIAASSYSLSEDTTEQAAAIQETAASIDEVSAMVKKSAENAAHSQTASQSSRAAALSGQHSVKEMISSIETISESNTRIMNQVEAGNVKIGEIVKVIGEIGTKTKVINDIVFQTKLLSFNASVEAARAGEHGKGFAVVAEEVGNLAQMSGNAAKEISSMLEESIEKVESIVRETKATVEKLVVESRENVEAGTLIARKCDKELVQILTAVEEVDGLVVGITVASNEQSQGVSEINKAINQLDQTTQKNAAVANQSAAGSALLKDEARKLGDAIANLNSMITGEKITFSEKKPSLALREAKKKPAGKENVVAFKRKEAASPKTTEPKKGLKLAAGAEYQTPSKDDPRFEDA